MRKFPHLIQPFPSLAAYGYSYTFARAFQEADKGNRIEFRLR